MNDGGDRERRAAELEALLSFYGEGEDGVQALGGPDERSPSSAAAADGPWRVRIGGPAHSPVTLELRLPPDYPSTSAPVPILRAPPWLLDGGRVAELVEEMVGMFAGDTEVAILWCEHARTALDDAGAGGEGAGESRAPTGDVDEPDESISGTDDAEGVRTFVPPTSRYNQPIRRFDAAVISKESNRRPIHRTQPFHPPKSGPSESMVAHVASVKSMDQVHWVLAELLFNDKKVAKATHNMFAYRFLDASNGCVVSDNDDDGEKGSGIKLAALLEMSECMDVIVVVSRWFGGVLLGPSRFKHIASVGRDGLVEAGFIGGTGGGDGSQNNAAGKKKGRRS